MNVNAANSLQLSSSDIAFISCDKSDYPGNLDASSTVSNVVSSKQKASAVLLYSSELHHCNYSSNEADAAQYPYVFTFLNPDFAKQIKTQLSSPKGNDTSEGNATVGVVPDMSFTMSGTPQTQDTGGGSSDNPNTGKVASSQIHVLIADKCGSHDHPVQHHGYHHGALPGDHHHRRCPGTPTSGTLRTAVYGRTTAAKSSTRDSKGNVRDHSDCQVW